MQTQLNRGMSGRRGWVVVALVGSLACSGSSNEPAREAETREPMVAEALTETLAELGAAYDRAEPAGRDRALADLVEIATRRHAALAALMRDDPRAVLQVALPEAVRGAMPPEVQGLLERRVDVEGDLEVMVEDYRDGTARLRHSLSAHGERLTLHFAGEAPGLHSGTPVHVSGVQIDDGMAVLPEGILTLAARGGSSGGSNGGTPAPALAALGEQRTLVVLVNFADAPAQPYTPDEARRVMFETTSQFYLESSFQQTWLAGDVVGWFTIAARSTECDTAAIATQAQSAAIAAGVDLARYGHLVYAFPQNACGFWGNSTLGGNPSQAWITGAFELGVTAHELGHGMGLFHSHALDCGATTLAATCTANEYGDMLDMMGSSPSAHFNALQKERLGWLGSGATAAPPITLVTTDGTYALEPYALSGQGPKALKILRSTDASTGKQTWYYVEARQPVGFDAVLATFPNATAGVLIHSGTPGGNSSYLLDMTPASGTTIYLDWRDAALAVGQTFRDAGSGVTITADAASATGAAVTVRFESTIATTTDRSRYTRGDVVTVKATVRSGANPVANAAVSFTIAKANGAVTTARATTGADGSATYKLRLRRDDPAGTYQATGVVDANAALRSTASFVVE